MPKIEDFLNQIACYNKSTTFKFKHHSKLLPKDLTFTIPSKIGKENVEPTNLNIVQLHKLSLVVGSKSPPV